MPNTKSELIGPRYIRQPRDLLRKGMYYKVHYSMIDRCYNTSHVHYEDYGGRGIKVCDRWLCPEMGLANFIDDLGPRPSWQHTLDRIDNDWIYIWYNCRWADWETQCNNRRNVVHYEFEGAKLSIAQIAKRTGINYKTLHNRLQYLGWDFERAITTGPFLGGNP